MNTEDFIGAVDDAILAVYEKDEALIGRKDNEKAVAHRFAVYLESYFPTMSVDLEYAPEGQTDLVQLPGAANCYESRGNGWAVLDVVAHRRMPHGDSNLAVFEIKSESLIDECDGVKLKGLTSKGGRFKFDYGMAMEFRRDYCGTVLFIDGEQHGDKRRVEPHQTGAGKPQSGVDEGFSAKSRALLLERANAKALSDQATRTVEGLSPDAAVERYELLKNKAITDLTESEYAERLALAERMSAILKEKKKRS